MFTLVEMMESLDPTLFEEDDSEQRRAHIIRRSEHLSAEMIISQAIAGGFEVVALCGYRWKPVEHASDERPVCTKCVDVWSNGG